MMMMMITEYLYKIADVVFFFHIYIIILVHKKEQIHSYHGVA